MAGKTGGTVVGEVLLFFVSVSRRLRQAARAAKVRIFAGEYSGRGYLRDGAASAFYFFVSVINLPYIMLFTE